MATGVLPPPPLSDFTLNQISVKSKDGLIITFYTAEDTELQKWASEIQAQVDSYTERKRKITGMRKMAIFLLLHSTIEWKDEPCVVS